MSKLTDSLEAQFGKYFTNNFRQLRQVDITDTLPPVTCPMIIVDDEGNLSFIEGGKRNRDTISGLYHSILPNVKDGNCKLLFVWIGEYRTDVFELQKDAVDSYMEYVYKYATSNWQKPFL